MRYHRHETSVSLLEDIKEQEQDEKAEKQKKRKEKYTEEHTTQPIKDLAMVNKWLRIAKEHDAHRKRGGVSWYLLLVIGFNTGLRISDICRLRVEDIYNTDHVRVMQRKTNKISNFPIKEDVQAALKPYLKGKSLKEFVITSRQKGSKRSEEGISRERAYGIICEVAKRAGYTGVVGCHTMRKTYGYQFYKFNGGKLSVLMKRFGHSAESITAHYIGLDQETIDKASEKVPSMI